ncbi:hypothetical protein G6F56_004514 [Rhizopus delemar]|nr:hypothetical protein G6F56_004514 [Rhizopus delemar]
MKFADMIIPRGLENAVAIDLVTKHVQTQLNENNTRFRSGLLDTPIKEIPNSVHILHDSNQIQGIHTILRDRTTERDVFVFYANRLAVLLMEYSINLFPSVPISVKTPIDENYSGLKYSQKICGVSILRAGGTMEAGLKRVFSDAIIGKLLIQTNSQSGDPELHYCKLPKDVQDYQIILMDALIGTGAAALMAIRVLLDHEVPLDQIIFLSFLSTDLGLTVITNAFPDRYFGTEEDDY